MTRKIALVAIVAMLATGTSVALALGAGPSGTNDAATSQNEAVAVDAAVQNETSNVTFLNQTSNGTAVVVNQTVLPEGGFIAIHLSENGTPGAVIGNSTYLEPGTHENVTVLLNESMDAVPLNESQVLIAMNHRDTNDNQQYDFPEADPPYLVNDQPVTDSAFITLEEEMNETTTEEM